MHLPMAEADPHTVASGFLQGRLFVDIFDPGSLGPWPRVCWIINILRNKQISKVFVAFALNKVCALSFFGSGLDGGSPAVATLRISEYLWILPPPPREPRGWEIPNQ